jgi:DNA repair exonuclease SbcCD ATPase subunit
MRVDDVTGFTRIYEAFKPNWYTCDSTQIRGREDEIYTHNPLMPRGIGQAALDRRREKYKDGAKLVKQALDYQYNHVGEAAFRSVMSTGRNLAEEVTRGDLELLHQELESRMRDLGLQTQELEQQKQELDRQIQELDQQYEEARLKTQELQRQNEEMRLNTQELLRQNEVLERQIGSRYIAETPRPDVVRRSSTAPELGGGSRALACLDSLP